MRYITKKGFEIIARSIQEKIKLLEINHTSTSEIELSAIKSLVYDLDYDFFYKVRPYNSAKFLKACFTGTKFDGTFTNNR